MTQPPNPERPEYPQQPGYPEYPQQQPGYPQQPPGYQPTQPYPPSGPYGQPQQPYPPQYGGYPPQLSPEMSRGYLPYGNYPAGGMQPVAPPPQAAYAHWGLRVAAYLIDSVLGALIYYPLLIVLTLIARVPFSTMSADGIPINAYDGTALIFGWDVYPDWFLYASICVYLAGIAFGFWNSVWRQGRTGQSLGKSLVRIRVIKEADGQPTGALLMLGRQLLHILDALPCYLGFLWPLWDDKRQTFADKLVHTVVVPVPPDPPEQPY